MLKSIVIFIILFSIPSFGNISAKRNKNQDYKEIIKRNGVFNQASDTALNSAGKFEDLDHNSVVEWDSMDVMQSRFVEIRDERFFEVQSGDTFLRRISWLYPDDGCFARAALFNDKAEEKSFERPKRIFIFGNLNVKTKNHPSGEVSWWYHTAPIVRVDGEVYVLDAAINPEAPLKVKDWILTQVDDVQSADISYCSTYTHSPYSKCIDADETTDDGAYGQQRTYLRYEWSRQEALGREPTEVLGDKPPWLDVQEGMWSLKDYEVGVLQGLSHSSHATSSFNPSPF